MRFQKITSERIFLLVSTLLLFSAIFTSSVSAVEGNGKKPTVSPKPTKQARLTEGKLRACQAKEDNLKKRMTSLSKLATNMEGKFDTITTRVKNHYTTKVVPSGKTVANYETLLAEIQTKKTAVQTALTAAQATANGFSCASDDPKGQVTQFRKDMQSVKSAFKDYRTAIKNLIVAVRSVNGNLERETTRSPKPTKAR